ncbi:hypothetical protein Rhopal_006436-T1 [Rhodotorula paludigena]|uniref:NADH:ubiquinone oxidoreductase intermediate-associated protein 30 domain-containing protein n=1 Tax=Rhodotorula paludigena TaxID=86838 RepID=A0AAV5GWH0_9BASI|nr:hypothetical protein Rhopal_006436-T1 [Rhodotorula paludigena]
MASPWKAYLARSVEHLRNTSQQGQHGDALPLVALRSTDDLAHFALGCDADLGGRSSVNLDLGPEGKGRFWGTLSNDLNPGRRKEGVIERGGYAGFRNKVCLWVVRCLVRAPLTLATLPRPTSDPSSLARPQQRTSLFGTQTWDTSLHDFLRLRVRSSGDGMRYFVNIQTDGPVRSDLFQHRLWLPSPASDSAPHEWTDVLIPFSDFTLTNSGDLSAQQLDMLRTRVRTVGISVLGPKEGRYELGIEAIDAVAVDDPSRARELGYLPPQKGADGHAL